MPSRRLALALALTLVAVLAASSTPAAAARRSPQVTFYFGLERPEAGARCLLGVARFDRLAAALPPPAG